MTVVGVTTLTGDAATQAPPGPAAPVDGPPRHVRAPRFRRLGPTAVAAVLAAVYVIVSPPSIDLAAHLYRAGLFARDGFGIWDNFWYGGHHVLGYSVLFPAVSAVLSPQVAAALAAVATAALFEALACRRFGPEAWLGAALFGAATAIDLFTGRLALAFGALPAMAAVLCLDRRRVGSACVLAAISALCSPVAALFAAIAAAGHAVAGLRAPDRPRAALAGAAVAFAALVPVGLLALLFPEGGTEPFTLGTLLPLLIIAAGVVALAGRARPSLSAGAALYAAAAIAFYLVASPVGSNIARLGTLLGAPLAVLVLWPSRRRLLALVILPLLYVGWQAPVRDVAGTAGDPAITAAYYRPLLRFLHGQSGGATHTFRIEIPLTRSHWEAYRVASQFPIARGWERQLDQGDNHIFYGGTLTAAGYARWLHADAIRFVALPDAALDGSATREAALIRGGLPYLRLVMRSAHWRVYAVRNATPMVTGAARLTAMGSDWLTLRATRAGTAWVHVHPSPYWALTRGSGCVAARGSLVSVRLRRPGSVRLAMRFSLGAALAGSPRCS